MMSLETGDNDLAAVVTDKLQRARRAARACATLSPSEKNAALEAMAVRLWEQRAEIVAANAIDVAQARAEGQTETRIDRLVLTEKRIQEMVEGLRQVQELRDPIGETLEVIERPNGLVIHKIRVPMGVLAMIYESRPNVTVDAAGLAVKTGNAVVLRGGREALHSNVALVQALRQGLANAGVADDAIQLIDRTERESVDLLIRAKGLVDLAIPRGGAGLIERVTQRALVPVIETGVGNCHVYVDGEADLQMASRIVQNAKVQRPSVCNAMESLLVHQAIAATWVPSIAATLNTLGVELRVCEKAKAILEDAGVPALSGLRVATEEDFATEFLGLVLAIKVVDSAAEAMEHIARYGTKHTEAIVTENVQTAEKFLSEVDAAVVVHNASTRFTDGFEFGFGAEIGISTQKLHARGPMGLRELTSYKYVIRGVGQVRG